VRQVKMGSIVVEGLELSYCQVCGKPSTTLRIRIGKEECTILICRNCLRSIVGLFEEYIEGITYTEKHRGIIVGKVDNKEGVYEKKKQKGQEKEKAIREHGI